MSFSRGEISVLIMPHMANILGDLFGGNLMALVDQAAAIAAIRHAGARVVTASIHKVDFRARISIGSLVTCRATVDFVGRSSMDITVEVFSETPSTGERIHATTAHLVFVAIDAQGQPIEVPRLVPATEEEKDRFAAAREYRRDHAGR
jgi:acyl-CoA hydrolase